MHYSYAVDIYGMVVICLSVTDDVAWLMVKS